MLQADTPTASRTDVRDDARTSLYMGQDSGSKSRFPKKRKRNFAAGWPNSRDILERAGEFSFFPQAALRLAQQWSPTMLAAIEAVPSARRRRMRLLPRIEADQLSC